MISPLPHAQLGSAAMGGARAGTAVGTAGAGNSLSRCDHCRRLWAAFLCFFDFSSAAAIFSAALATFFGSAFFFFFLQVCRCSTAMASSDIAGRTRWDSILKFSVLSSSLFGWILEVVEAVTTSSSTEPTPLLSGQSRKCSLVSGTPQVEQFGLSSNLNLCSFTLVGRRSWSLTGQWHFLNELLQNCHWPVNKRKWRQFNTDYFIASPIAECGHGSEKTTMKADCTRAVRRQKKGAKKGASYRRLYIRVQASYRRLEKRRRLGAFFSPWRLKVSTALDWT